MSNSKDSFILKGICSKTGKMFGITVEPDWRNQINHLVWAFKINSKSNKHEQSSELRIIGQISKTDGFNGCPYCGEKEMGICPVCGYISCYNGESSVVCPNCKTSMEAKKSAEDPIDMNVNIYEL